MNYSEFIKALEAQGYKEGGSGSFGKVWLKPGSEEAVKVSYGGASKEGQRDGWPLWAAYCRKHPSSAVPAYGEVIRTSFKEDGINRSFFHCVMPRCLSLGSPSSIRAKFGEKRLEELNALYAVGRRAFKSGIDISSNVVEDEFRQQVLFKPKIEKEGRVLIDYINGAREFLKVMREHRDFDLKQENWLVSPEGKLWPNDPVGFVPQPVFETWWGSLTKAEKDR